MPEGIQGSGETERPSLTVEFRPVVEAASGTCSGEYAFPSKGDADAEAVLAEGTTGRAVEQSVLVGNMSAIIRAAGARLEANLLAGRQVKVIAPINIVALSIDSVAGEFSTVCHTISDEARANLMFEVVGLPKAPSLDMIDHAAIILFPFCGGYIARPNPGTHDVKVFTNTNFSGISFDLKDKPWPVDKIMPRLEAFKAAAAAHRLSAYLLGCGTNEIAIQGNGLGFEYLCGEAVKEEVAV